MMQDTVEFFRQQGYAILRGVFSAPEMAEISAEADKVYAAGLKHHASFRDRNLYFEVIDDPAVGRRIVAQAHWFSWINPRLEALRRDPRIGRILEPLLGRDIKQIANQIHWKPPTAKFTSYRFHQDLKFREKPEDFQDIAHSSINVGLAIDGQGVENGGLQIFPGSHKHGYLGLSDDGPIMVGTTQEDELRRAGLDPKAALTCELVPGDLVLWTLLTVHGSGPNRSGRERRFNINSYVRADSTERGEWAFRDGQSVPLGPEPKLCKYEQLVERPGPFYIEDRWYEEA
jgi:ectoine hydroxylase-related dioxygenase (phytanoyl-CoA dioxygenase family)